MSASVYTGRWVDYSQGNVLGSRVTMTTSNATVLIAFVALFDALVGNAFWNLLAYFIHQRRAKSSGPQDGLSRQLQVLLRNSNEPLALAQNAIYTGWRWRKRAPRALCRSIFIAVLACFISVGFAVAGVFSSRIASSGSVLLTSAACGFFPRSPWGTVQSDTIEIEAGSQATAALYESIEYAKKCYANPLQNQSFAMATLLSPGADCDFYVKPTLNWTTTFDNPCPFADKSVCSVPDADIIKLDTGLLDSEKDLGINLGPSNNVLFRRVEICSPLTTIGFSNNSFASTGLPGSNSEAVIYSYGSSTVQPDGSLIVSNYTAYVDYLFSNNVTFLYPQSDYAAADVPYYLVSQSVLVANTNNLSERGFVPDFQITADPFAPVSLFFLANRALYLGEPVKDPWFRATTARNDTAVPTFWNTVPGTVLGCVDQQQVCKPSSNNSEPLCSDLDHSWIYGYEGETALALALDMNPLQAALAMNVLGAMGSTSFGWVVTSVGSDALTASSSIFTNGIPFTPALPSNQWQIEVENWMAISNAWMQRMNLMQVTGPTDYEASKYWQLVSSPETLAEFGADSVSMNQQLCAAQKINSTAYQSFSVVGLCVNFVLGGLILLASLGVRYAAPSLKRRRDELGGSAADASAKDEVRQAWTVDGMLQLQRIAYESRGLGEWEGADVSVPLTGKGQLLPTPRIVERDGVEVVEYPLGGGNSGATSSRSLTHSVETAERGPPRFGRSYSEYSGSSRA